MKIKEVIEKISLGMQVKHSLYFVSVWPVSYNACNAYILLRFSNMNLLLLLVTVVNLL